jgi:hypothetical protein
MGVAVAAALAVAIIFVASFAGYAAARLFDAWSGAHEARAFAAGEPEALFTGRVAISLFAFQIVTIVSVLVVNALWRRFAGTTFLRFGMPPGGIKTLSLAVVVLVSLATLFAGLVFALDPNALRHDLQPFAEMMQSRTWWLILIAAGIGAPLAEELLFRGLIFGALRRSPLGFAGAAVITAASWALLHANYSVYGLAAIAFIGVYLAWLRERTGSLLTPMVCHGAYNSLIILLMAFAPSTSLATG